MTPIVKGFEGCADEPSLPLPKEMSWAATGTDTVIPTAFAFLAAEAEIMAECFVSPALKTYMETWISTWDGAKTVPTKAWLASEVGGPISRPLSRSLSLARSLSVTGTLVCPA